MVKVNEVIKKLNVGDEVWLKGKINDKVLPTEETGCSTIYPIHVSGFGYIGKDTEISLSEPQAEKVEVSQEFADWAEKSMMWKYDGSWVVKEIVGYGWGAFMHDPETEEELLPSKYPWVKAVQNNKEKHIKAIYDGYTVKPKRWVVKNEKGYVAMENFKDFDNHKIGVKFTIVSEKLEAAYWDNIDHAKAEAVAVLVDGSVEEV